MNIGKALGLAATKKLRAKKRKLVKNFGNAPANKWDMYDTKVSDLYDNKASMIKINYNTIFSKKNRSKYFTSMNKLNKWRDG